MSGVSLLTIAAVLLIAFALWFIVYRIIWSPYAVYFSLYEGGAQDEAAGYNSFSERLTFVVFTDVWLVAAAIWGLLTSIYYTVRDNPEIFIGLFLVMGASILVATYDSEILEAIDEVWHEVIFPAYDNVLRPLLVAFRDLYNVLIPWYNLFVAAVPDTIIFTVELFVECDLSTWQESINALADIVEVVAEELSLWVIRVVNNRGASFNFFRVIKSITAFIGTLIDKFGCLCYELSWLWCSTFTIIDADSLAISIDQFLNFFLCFADIILDWILALIENPKENPIPNFTFAFDKLCNSSKAFGEWVVVIVQTIVQEFITDDNVIPDFSCLIGSPICSVVKVAQALFDLLSNELSVLEDISEGVAVQYLLQDFEYNQVFAELLNTGQCIADVTSFWNVTALNLIGCALNNVVRFASFVAKLPVDWVFQLFAIGPTCLESVPQCAEDYLDFIQGYNFTNILESARDASECTFAVLGLINEDFACAGDNLTNAVICGLNITIEMVLHPELVFTSTSFWMSLPFDQLFIDVENAFRCIGALFKSFASDPNKCPPHVVDFQSGGDDDDDEQVNFWCCTGNSIEGLGVAVVGLGQMLFDVLLDLIEEVGVEELAQNAFTTYSTIILPNLEIGLDNLACIPLSIFEDLTCPSGGFYNFDDDDDSANTQVGEALEAWTITIINITLIPAKVVEIVLAAFLADVSNCDESCIELLNEFVCPSCDITDPSQGVTGCIIVGIVDALLLPFINNLQGMGAVAGCFLDGKSTSAQDFFRGAARILTSLVNDVDTKVVPVFVCTYDFWEDIFQGNYASLPGDIVRCLNKMSSLAIQILKFLLVQFPDDLLDAFETIVCDIPGVKEICDLKRDVYQPSTEEGYDSALTAYMKRFDWSGSSRCDRLVQNYPRYMELGLEGVGRAEVSHCVMLRVLADSVNQLSPWEGIPLIDQDAFDNPVRVLEFMKELPSGVQAYNDWMETAEYMDVHERVWTDSWAPNGTHPHLQLEIRDMDHYLHTAGIRSRGVITLLNGVTDFFNRISDILVRARATDKQTATKLLTRYRMRLIEESVERSQVRALRYRPEKAVKRQLRLADSRREVRALSSSMADSVLSNISAALQPRSPRAIQNRAQASRFTKRLKQAWQVTLLENPRHHQRRQRLSLRDTCGFPGQSCTDSDDCCPGLVCVDHSSGMMCSTDLCARLFDDDDDNGSRFDCEDVCSYNCTGCNWLQDVFCEVYLQRFADVLFRVATGQVPCVNATATPAPTPIPSPIIDKEPPNSFAWQVFTWITRNIFGISNKRIVELINDIGNFIINTNVDPDEGEVGLAGTIVGFFFCEYSELSACSGPGIAEGLAITLPIYFIVTVLMSYVFPATGWLLDVVWMSYVPVLIVVSYEVGLTCYLRSLPLPNLPENLADDLLDFADSIFTPFINWNGFLPGLLIVTNGQRTFLSCSREVGFVNWSDNFVYALQWWLPSLANFLRTTDYFALRWIRELPFLSDSFDNPELDFSGSPPDAETSCFYITSLNWAGFFFVVALGALFIVFSVLLAYLAVVTVIAVMTWIAYTSIETSRQTRLVRLAA